MSFLVEHMIGARPVEGGEVLEAVLGEAGRFAADVIVPLNPVGDVVDLTLGGHFLVKGAFADGLEGAGLVG